MARPSPAAGQPETAIHSRDHHSPWVWLARIRRPQGRKGEVFADILTDFPEKFAERRRLWLLPEIPNPRLVTGHDFSRAYNASKRVPGALAPAPREAELIHHWPHKGGIVLHFAGVDSISAAESLAGLIVAIPRAERAALPAGEVHIADLIGCTLIDVAANPPKEIGEIANVERTADSAPLLIVKSHKGEVLIPFAQIFIRMIDLDRRRVEMSLPEGLATLNE